MTITIDWGAVVAMGVMGTAVVAVTRLFVRDEIRKVTNGKFEKIDRRLSLMERGQAVLKEHVGLTPRRYGSES